MFPLHFWLPGAHAAAPSHVSALLSGVMLKMGIYGLLRVARPAGPAAGLVGLDRCSALGLGLGRPRRAVGARPARPQARSSPTAASRTSASSCSASGWASLGTAYRPPGVALLGYAGGAAAHARTTRCSRACCSWARGPWCTRRARARSIGWAGSRAACRCTALAFLIGSVAIVRPAAAQRLRERVGRGAGPSARGAEPDAAGARGARRCRPRPDRRARPGVLQPGGRRRLPGPAASAPEAAARDDPGLVVPMLRWPCCASCSVPYPAIAVRPAAARRRGRSWRGALMESRCRVSRSATRAASSAPSVRCSRSWWCCCGTCASRAGRSHAAGHRDDVGLRLCPPRQPDAVHRLVVQRAGAARVRRGRRTSSQTRCHVAQHRHGRPGPHQGGWLRSGSESALPPSCCVRCSKGGSRDTSSTWCSRWCSSWARCSPRSCGTRERAHLGSGLHAGRRRLRGALPAMEHRSRPPLCRIARRGVHPGRHPGDPGAGWCPGPDRRTRRVTARWPVELRPRSAVGLVRVDDSSGRGRRRRRSGRPTWHRSGRIAASAWCTACSPCSWWPWSVVVTSQAMMPFLAAWEVMAVRAYLLVVFESERADVRRAGLVYIVLTHTSLLALLGMFAALSAHAEGRSFADLAAGSQAASTGAHARAGLRARGVRHQGRRRPAALLAAGRARGGPVARLRDPVRRHAQDGDLRPAARAQPAGLTAGLVRVDPVRARTRRRACWACSGRWASTTSSGCSRTTAWRTSGSSCWAWAWECWGWPMATRWWRCWGSRGRCCTR